MITKTNFKKLLELSGFENKDEKNIYRKEFPFLRCELSVDFNTETLVYPQKIKGGERNNGFNAPENFVVFECVNRLLEKGYRPEHIELEKQWHLGHDTKSGRADICVSDFDGKMLFIIECKTWGREFEKAYKDTEADGGQLFSYCQQENATRWLLLYTSDISDEKIVYKAPSVSVFDDPNIENAAKKDETVKLYANAYTAPEKHRVWKETYSLKWYENLVFSDDSIAYKIGVKPLLKKDLQNFAPEDRIVNKFEEILRHNNVSDKENAFNRLVALFICKLVDEINKDDNDEVEFQYKQGTDTYESLQDRLQRLHKEGMEAFMHEKIFYVSDDYPDLLFSNYTGQKRKKAIEDLRGTIRILKFYSNNDFSFKDVHNEELFYQNGKILVEVVELFQKYRIVYPSKHQFLGDLFEQLLNKGFKQNEGQFFTPMPITRFIWDSLPLSKITHCEKGVYYPKIIDYACGAGHFLTEAVEAVNAYIESDGDNLWAKEHIYGIEKDYRLARVAKISLYMNGAGDGNIIFGDGLENLPERQIENGSFDILVANPPYSVKDFKQHLQIKNNSFELLSSIGDNGSEIETLFAERIGQLLKPRGVAAIILPSSILSNDSASYTGAREQILKNFKIRSIVQLGSKTFGATGTNTVILFLEKYSEPPKRIDLICDSVNAILSGEEMVEWEDKKILEAYINKIESDRSVYEGFILQRLSFDELNQDEYFKMYADTFLTLSETIKYVSTKAYRNLPVDKQSAELLNRFYNYLKAAENDKLTYFAMTYNQKTVVITSPSDNSAQKEFLGYDWSNRKGNEGIKIINYGGKMFNADDRKAPNTVASVIRSSFEEKIPDISEENKAYISVVETSDMLDFSRVSFNKAIRTSVKKKIELKSKYPLDFLTKHCKIIKGVTYDKANQTLNETKNIILTADNITLDGHFNVKKKIFLADELELDTDKKLYKNDIFICLSSGSKKHVGKVAFIDSDTDYYAGGFMGIIRCFENINAKYIFNVLNSTLMRQVISSESAGGNIQNLSNKMLDIKIPIPPFEIQKKIIKECEKVDKEYNSIRMSVEEYHKKIENIFSKYEVITKS